MRYEAQKAMESIGWDAFIWRWWLVDYIDEPPKTRIIGCLMCHEEHECRETGSLRPEAILAIAHDPACPVATLLGEYGLLRHHDE